MLGTDLLMQSMVAVTDQTSLTTPVVEFMRSLCLTWKENAKHTAQTDHLDDLMQHFEKHRHSKSFKAKDLFLFLDGYYCGSQNMAEDRRVAAILSSFVRTRVPAVLRAEALMLMDTVVDQRKLLLNVVQHTIYVGDVGIENIQRILEASEDVRKLVDQYVRLELKELEDLPHVEELCSSIDHLAGLVTAGGQTAVRQHILRCLRIGEAFVGDASAQTTVKKTTGLLVHLARRAAQLAESQNESSTWSLYERHPTKFLSQMERLLVRKALSFLAKFCKGNRANQDILPVSFILDSFSSAELGEIELLQNMASANRVNATAFGDHARNIIRDLKIASHIARGESSDLNGEIQKLELLRSLVYSEGQPVERMQSFVCRSILRGNATDKDFWYGRCGKYVFLNIDQGEMQEHSSRLQYHVTLCHLLAECATDNTDCAAQLRHTYPLEFFCGAHSVLDGVLPGVLSRKNLLPKLYAAHAHLFQAAYIDMLSANPDAAITTLISSPVLDSDLDSEVILGHNSDDALLDFPYCDARINCIADMLQVLLRIFLDSDVRAIYPADAESSGDHPPSGILPLLTKLFEVHFFELSDAVDVHLKNSKVSVVALIERLEKSIAIRLAELVKTVGNDQRRKFLLSGFAAACNASSAFDAQKVYLCDAPKTDLKQSIDEMRQEMSHSGVTADTRVDSFDTFRHVCRAAWDDESSNFSWAQRTYPEDLNTSDFVTQQRERESLPPSSYWWSSQRDLCWCASLGCSSWLARFSLAHYFLGLFLLACSLTCVYSSLSCSAA
eukprot:SAG11_NODE_34_length_22265_cov_11.264730_18_plen_783_part_00